MVALVQGGGVLLRHQDQAAVHTIGDAEVLLQEGRHLANQSLEIAADRRLEMLLDDCADVGGHER
eukprot:1124134-Alexandrium_andersonii.AAC.1